MSEQMAVTVEELNKSFGTHKVIDSLSFSIAAGERLAVFAPSGAGKTTLIKIIGKLEKADSGQVRLGEATPAIIFQEPRLFPFLTVSENILLPFKVKGQALTSDLQHSYQRWLEVCELGEFVNYYPFQLSGGMRQKVALIRGLLPSPRFIMLDEPFQSINVLSKQRIMEHILQTMPELSFLFVSHIADEIPAFAQTVLYFSTTCLSHPERLAAVDLKNKLSVSHLLFTTDEK